MSTPPAWSQVLQRILKTSNERQRLAAALGVTVTTLSRWAQGDYTPKRDNLVQLVRSVPSDSRQELLDALSQQFPDIHAWLKDEAIASDQVPNEFFSHVLNIRTITTENLLFWRISDMVLRQALEQLDPNQLGMAIKLVKCMPPSPADGRIHSLRECAGRGTPPWTADLEHDVLFLGLESMSGYTVEVRHVVSEDDLTKGRAFPAYQAEKHEISAAAHPIRLEGQIAGCLLASSTQEGYFSQQRLSQLALFSDLIALALQPSEFYPPEKIELRVMPRPEVQRPVIATFRQRVTKKFQEAVQSGQRLNNQEAEQRVWQEIEEELLAYQVKFSTQNDIYSPR